jgi:hypothetical protein
MSTGRPFGSTGRGSRRRFASSTCAPPPRFRRSRLPGGVLAGLALVALAPIALLANKAAANRDASTFTPNRTSVILELESFARTHPRRIALSSRRGALTYSMRKIKNLRLYAKPSSNAPSYSMRGIKGCTRSRRRALFTDSRVGTHFSASWPEGCY